MEYDDNEDYIKYEDAYKKYLEGLYEVIIPVIGTVQHALSEKYNIEKDMYELECQDTTTLEGQFELNLNHGKYKLVVDCDGFVQNNQIIDV